MAETQTVEQGTRVLTVRMLKELLNTLPPEADNQTVTRWDADVKRLVDVQEVLPATRCNLFTKDPSEHVIVLH